MGCRQIAKKALRPGDQQRFVDCIGEGGGETASKLEQFHIAVPLDSLIPVRTETHTPAHWTALDSSNT
jgi:hypothetical protein